MEGPKVATGRTVGPVTLLGEIPPQKTTWVRGAHLAWKQRSLVTGGQPLITGTEDFLTWDDIHLEARVCSSEHGYPGLHYRDNLVQDFAGIGIVVTRPEAYHDISRDAPAGQTPQGQKRRISRA